MLKRVFLCMVSCITIMALTGCGKDNVVSNNSVPNQTFDNVVILAGNHGNSVKPKYDSLNYVLQNVALNYGCVDICVTDGDPFIARSLKIPEQKKGLSSNKKNTIAQSQVEQIKIFLNSAECIARTEEVDLLKSFELASRIVKSTDYAGDSNAIYVFDTGLNSCGMLNFTDMNLNCVDVDNLLLELEKQNLIVDLSDTTIFWYGLSDTILPQEDLSATQKDTVKRIWEGYLAKTGATVHFMTDISTDTFEMELPDVTPIVSVMTSIEWNDESVKQEFPPAIVYNEEVLSFNAGTATLRDEYKAVEELKTTIDYMNENESFKLTIIGCTAKWGNLEKYCKPLSLERCETVKKILVDSGINEDRIFVIGMGYDNPFYINDQDEYGELIESIAKENRCIVLLDSNSDMALSIENDSWKE